MLRSSESRSRWYLTFAVTAMWSVLVAPDCSSAPPEESAAPDEIERFRQAQIQVTRRGYRPRQVPSSREVTTEASTTTVTGATECMCDPACTADGVSCPPECKKPGSLVCNPNCANCLSLDKAGACLVAPHAEYCPPEVSSTTPDATAETLVYVQEPFEDTILVGPDWLAQRLYEYCQDRMQDGFEGDNGLNAVGEPLPDGSQAFRSDYFESCDTTLVTTFSTPVGVTNVTEPPGAYDGNCQARVCAAQLSTCVAEQMLQVAEGAIGIEELVPDQSSPYSLVYSVPPQQPEASALIAEEAFRWAGIAVTVSGETLADAECSGDSSEVLVGRGVEPLDNYIAGILPQLSITMDEAIDAIARTHLAVADSELSRNSSQEVGLERAWNDPVVSRGAAAHVLLGGDRTAGFAGVEVAGLCPESVDQRTYDALDLLSQSAPDPSIVSPSTEEILGGAAFASATLLELPSRSVQRTGVDHLTTAPALSSYLEQRGFTSFDLRGARELYAAFEDLYELNPSAELDGDGMPVWYASTANYRSPPPDIYYTGISQYWEEGTLGANRTPEATVVSGDFADVWVARRSAAHMLAYYRRTVQSLLGHDFSSQVEPVVAAAIEAAPYTLEVDATGPFTVQVAGLEVSDFTSGTYRLVAGVDALRCAVEGSIHGARCDFGMTSDFRVTPDPFSNPSQQATGVTSVGYSSAVSLTTTTAPTGTSRGLDGYPLFLLRSRNGETSTGGAILPPGSYEAIGSVFVHAGEKSSAVVAPRLIALVGDLLRPDPYHCGSPALDCSGLSLNTRVALEDELSENFDGVENSWRHQLDIAETAARRADQLGQALIENGLEIERRVEVASNELEAICGVSVDLSQPFSAGPVACGDIGVDCVDGEPVRDPVDNILDPEGTRNMMGMMEVDGTDADTLALQACLGEANEAYVSLGRDPMCFYLHNGTMCDQAYENDATCPVALEDGATCDESLFESVFLPAEGETYAVLDAAGVDFITTVPIGHTWGNERSDLLEEPQPNPESFDEFCSELDGLVNQLGRPGAPPIPPRVVESLYTEFQAIAMRIDARLSPGPNFTISFDNGETEWTSGSVISARNPTTNAHWPQIALPRWVAPSEDAPVVARDCLDPRRDIFCELVPRYEPDFLDAFSSDSLVGDESWYDLHEAAVADRSAAVHRVARALLALDAITGTPYDNIARPWTMRISDRRPSPIAAGPSFPHQRALNLGTNAPPGQFGDSVSTTVNFQSSFGYRMRNYRAGLISDEDEIRQGLSLCQTVPLVNGIYDWDSNDMSPAGPLTAMWYRGGRSASDSGRMFWSLCPADLPGAWWDDDDFNADHENNTMAPIVFVKSDGSLGDANELNAHVARALLAWRSNGSINLAINAVAADYGSLPIESIPDRWSISHNSPDLDIAEILSAQDVVDGLSLACGLRSAGARFGSCGVRPEVNGEEDYGRALRYLKCKADEVGATGDRVVLEGVPVSALRYLAENEQAGGTGRTRLGGTYGEAVQGLISDIIELKAIPITVSASLDRYINALSDAMASVRAIERSEEAAEVQAALTLATAASTCAGAAVEAIVSAANIQKTGGAGIASNVSSCANSMIGALGAIDSARRNIDQLDEDRDGVFRRLDDQTTALSEAIESAKISLEVAASRLRQKIKSIDNQSAAAQRAVRQAQVFSAAGAGSAGPVNSLLRRRMTTTYQRYQSAHHRAIQLAYLARRSVEQRLGVDLLSIDEELSLVDAPSSWASNLCRMTGIDYNRLRDETDVEAESYADEFVGDYVDRLRRTVESYRFDYPFHEGVDTAVVSLRDEIMQMRGMCEVSSVNRLSYSSDVASGMTDAYSVSEAPLGRWLLEGCVQFPDSEARQEGVPSLRECGSPEQGEEVTLYFRETGAQLFDVRSGDPIRPTTLTTPPSSALGCPDDDGDGVADCCSELSCDQCDPACTSYQPGVSLVQYVRIPRGEYVLSWYSAGGELPGGSALSVISGGGTLYEVDGSFVATEASDVPRSTLGTWTRFRRTYRLESSEEDVLVRVSLGASAPADFKWTFGGVMLESISSGVSAEPHAFVATGADGTVVARACSDDGGAQFRSQFTRRCERLCPNGLPGGCEASDLVETCYREAAFRVDTSSLGSRYGVGLAGGNFNYRHGTVALNVIGEGIRDCENAVYPSTCYSNGFLPFSLIHEGPYVVTNYDGVPYDAPLYTGRISGARALEAERYLTNPLGSTDRALLSDYSRGEFAGRPLSGRYRIRIHETPELHFTEVRDIQLLLNYRYWTRFE